MIEIEIKDDEVTAALQRVAASLADMAPLMDDLGETLLRSTKKRVQAGMQPDGTPFAPRSATTLARSARLSARTGSYVHSFDCKLRARNSTWGVNAGMGDASTMMYAESGGMIEFAGIDWLVDGGATGVQALVQGSMVNLAGSGVVSNNTTAFSGDGYLNLVQSTGSTRDFFTNSTNGLSSRNGTIRMRGQSSGVRVRIDVPVDGDNLRIDATYVDFRQANHRLGHLRGDCRFQFGEHVGALRGGAVCPDIRRAVDRRPDPPGATLMLSSSREAGLTPSRTLQRVFKCPLDGALSKPLREIGYCKYRCQTLKNCVSRYTHATAVLSLP